MFYTYILNLGNQSYYVGYSTNLRERIKHHDKIELVYYSAFKDRSKAVNFEKYLKSSSGAAFRNKHLI